MMMLIMPKLPLYLEQINSLKVESPEDIEQLLAFSGQVPKRDLTREHREELSKIISDKIYCGFEVIRKNHGRPY